VFLGCVYVGDKENIIDRKKIPKYEDKQSYEMWFDDIKHDIEKHGKDGKLTTCYDVDYELIGPTKIKAISHIYVGGICSTEEDRDHDYFILNPNTNEKYFNDEFKKYLKRVECGCFHNSIREAKTYLIDETTVKITEYMLKHGYKMRFEKWENPQNIRKRLKKGEKIIAMKISESGDGMGSDHIFKEGDKSCFKDIPIETLSSEYL